MLLMSRFRPGDQVTYKMTKQSDHPTLRAVNVSPSEKGDDYAYVVEKYWVVRELTDHGTVIVQTRRGKTREIPVEDPRLKRASWWDKLIYRQKFPSLEQISADNNLQESSAS